MGILGIDLGTTNSLIAYYDEGGPHIVPNQFGDKLTPTIVSLGENDEVFVGRIASERFVTHPSLTAAAFKRSMGTAKKYPLGEREFLPEELSSFVIRKLIEDAEAYLSIKVEEVIISVPAYFNDVQRKATQRAGELAGVKVGRLINEPTAASIAYGMDNKESQTKFLIIDLGGGTFDVSILERYHNIMEVRGVAGDNYLGGEDFTQILIGLFLEKYQLRAEELDSRESAMLYKAAELSKRELGMKERIELRCRIHGKEHELNISEEEYEKACKGLLQRLRKPIERALSDASIKLNEIDMIVLVGGSTKLPFVRKFVGKLFKKFPSSHINPEEVVGLGTALQAAMKERNESIKEIVLTDVCPYTLGTNVSVSKEDGRIEGGHFLPIIERNTVIPVSKTERLFTLHDNQRVIRIQILQGESRFSENNILLGEVNISIPMKRKGEESVDVRYTYDINGILEVIVTVISTGIIKRMVIEQNPGYMSQEEVERRLHELESIKIHPREQEENKLLIARGERLYEENIGEARRYIEECLEEFETILDRQNPVEVKHAADLLREQLESIEACD